MTKSVQDALPNAADIPPPSSPPSPAAHVRRWAFVAACTSPEAHAVYRPAELHVAMCIAVHINDKRPGQFPWPSVATLARETGFDRSTVIRHINRLCGGPWPLFRRHVTPGKPTHYEPVASRTPATGTSRTTATSTGRTGSPTSRTSAPNPSHQCDTNSVEQSRTLSERARETPDGVPGGFTRAWTAYPSRRRSGKQEALEVWIRRGLDEHVDGVLAWIVYLTRTEWVAEDGRYAPKFPAWLEDVEPTETPPQAVTNGVNGCGIDWHAAALDRLATSGEKIAALAAEEAGTEGDFMATTEKELRRWPSNDPLPDDHEIAAFVVEMHEVALETAGRTA